MRITGGAWRGRRLAAARQSAARPTTDRVREAIFSILGDLVEGSAVVDLCCGSGALGIEALSRGAAGADFVDLDPACLAATRANLERCGAPADRWRLHRGDAARWLTRRFDAAGPPVLVLADPPYGGPAATALRGVLAAAPPARMLAAVLEHDGGEAWALPLHRSGSWTCLTRTYGNTTLTVMRPASAGAPEADDA